MEDKEIGKHCVSEYNNCNTCKHRNNPLCNVNNTCIVFEPYILYIGKFKFNRNYYHSKYEQIK